MGACSGFAKGTKRNPKFCGNIPGSKYFKVYSLEKQENTFSRNSLIEFFREGCCVKFRDQNQSLGELHSISDSVSIPASPQNSTNVISMQEYWDC